MDGFLQTPPPIPDAWTSDRVLRETLLFYLGEDVFAQASPSLAEVGGWATSPETLSLVRRAEREIPELVQYDPWGRRVDEIRVSDAYTALGRYGVERGVVAQAYEAEPFGERARLVWAALIYLWGPSSALYSCPIAMTDAAARTLLQHGGPEELAAVDHLTSRDPETAWTSGQWMTETAGGSDVSGTGTVARLGDGVWRLYGMKWFTSATTSEMALTLARPEGSGDGGGGLGLFRIHRALPDGSPNSILVRRLKDKLGTRSMPTAELELDGAIAYPVGDPLDGRGVAKISTMLNITRLHNALASAAALGRGLAWARSFARQREVFGRSLHLQPAHRATLADLAVDHHAAVVLAMRCAQLIGVSERGRSSDAEEALLRGLTPVTKAATARWAVAGAAEAMEALGGVGYCEDSGMPALVRNAHVLPIWEGTTNVLSLDLMRAAFKADSISVILSDVERACRVAGSDPSLAPAVAATRTAASTIKDRLAALGTDAEALASAARSITMGLANTYACALLSEQGAWAAARGDARTASAALRLAARGLVPAPPPMNDSIAMDDEIVTQLEA